MSRKSKLLVCTTYTNAGQKVELEERADKLRSILSQLEFSHIVCDYDRRGIPFRSHLHVPEVHPDTGHTWYEREDPAHVLKVGLCLSGIDI